MPSPKSNERQFFIRISNKEFLYFTHYLDKNPPTCTSRPKPVVSVQLSENSAFAAKKKQDFTIIGKNWQHNIKTIFINLFSLILFNQKIINLKSVFTCCWWAIVCFTRTLLMLCSKAYFFAFWTSSCWEEESLGRVKGFWSRLAPGPSKMEPIWSACGMYTPFSVRMKIKSECLNKIKRSDGEKGMS